MNDVGGPFQYGPRLKDEFQSLGHEVTLVSYGKIEKFLPIGLRHLYFLIKIIWPVFRADYILTLDTYSVGVPTIFVASMLNRKTIVRVGGDYFWSAYVNRTGEKISLREFYKSLPKLSWKERVILSLTKKLLNRATFLAFNTEWQNKIWKDFYGFRQEKAGVIRNFIPKKKEFSAPQNRDFIWAGRVIPEKNLETLKKVATRVSAKYTNFKLKLVFDKGHDEVLEILRTSYAAVSAAFSDICPNFILEAVSFNKPFIMTKETGFPEIYPQGGIFVDPFDEDAWVRAFETMLDNGSYNTLLRELKTLSPRHSWKDLAEEYLGIWSRAK